MALFSFANKILPKFSSSLFTSKPSRVVGIDIGITSTKVVQLRYERERAILETYGELKNAGYFQGPGEGTGTGILRHLDQEIGTLITDVLRESNVTTDNAVFSIPAVASFITAIKLPPLSEKELAETVPFEARKYIPIPITEVVLDWDILNPQQGKEGADILLVAVPREIIEKIKKVAQAARIRVQAIEVESFSITRSLVGNDRTPTALINLGEQSTTLAITDEARLKESHSYARGSHELTLAIERGLSVSEERAEAVKREIGLSERMEDRETSSLLTPLVDTLFSEIERTINFYNRSHTRHIQKINLTGGGSRLKGLIDSTSIKFGIEVTQGNPFHRVATPAFMQPILRDIGPAFSVAVGLALHEIN